MAKPLTDTEREAVIEALQAGESVRGTAKQFGCSPMTVSNIGKAAGVESGRTFTKRAADARRDYALANRLELLNRLFDKVDNLLAAVTDTADLQRLTVTAGILIDKRRLEDGDVTSRTETVGDDARDRIARKLDELAERRRARDVAS